ncbi:hypothetical protein [Agrobacterium sp. OT33]|uniref:hypothetical protein n=1 Tax=Agrobacterium sp. OT33 TaxID=2815338 RepID=UPI001A8E0A36|nr:hypothetical protein [Agrobacterium sp. OT33]MBO0125111.1 hypothetical protein [Agrobacterium sp. OT33]
MDPQSISQTFTQRQLDESQKEAIGGGIITDLADNAEYALNELGRANEEFLRLSKVLGLGL